MGRGRGSRPTGFHPQRVEVGSESSEGGPWRLPPNRCFCIDRVCTSYMGHPRTPLPTHMHFLNLVILYQLYGPPSAPHIHFGWDRSVCRHRQLVQSSCLSDVVDHSAGTNFHIRVGRRVVIPTAGTELSYMGWSTSDDTYSFFICFDFR